MASRIAKKRAEEESNKLEGFVHIDEDDVKHAVEIPVKEKQVEKIEKIGEKIEMKTRKKTKKTIKKVKKLKKGGKEIRVGNKKIILEKPKIKSIKTGGHILIITEKPQAALKISSALGNARKYSDNGVPYYELTRNNEKIIVAAAVGHLFTINQKPGETGFPIFDVEWIPSYLKKAEFTKKYYFTLLRLVKDAKEFIVASVDYNELTPVVENGSIKIVKIGEFVDKIIKDKQNLSDFKIPAFDSSGKIYFKNLKNVIRHKINEDLYELSLDYGRKVRITSSHNVFSIKDNEIKIVKTSVLKIGDKILCPAVLPSPQNIKIQKEINLLELRKFDNRDIFLEGEDIAKLLKRRIFGKNRKVCPLNDARIILTNGGAEKIREERVKKGYSTKKAGSIAGISQSLVVLWENKTKNPTKTNFEKYLNNLGINSKKFINNKKFCKMGCSSFDNLLREVFDKQYKNYSDFKRATIQLSKLTDEEAQKINNACIYGSKNKRSKLPVLLKLDKKLVRVLGYFLAEGDINQNYRIRFSLGKKGYGHEENIINEIKDFCKSYNLKCNYYIHNKIKHQVITIDNSVLASLFKNISKFGNKANNKRIPELIINLPIELKKEFLRAYFLGDGSISKTNISFNTSSELLSLDLSYLLLQLGILTSTYKAEKTGKGGGPNWHVIVSGTKNLNNIQSIWKDHHKSNILYLSKHPMKKRNTAKFRDLMLLKIKGIKKVRSSSPYVYDLSVEGENFIAGNGGVCCHNTDYDIEGEVIGWNVVRFIAEKNDAKRMKFSSLTKAELENAYDNASKSINWGLAIAGDTRHHLDWLYGINLSRALMAAIKAAGAFRIMSIGRVQGPTLALVVDKELLIKKFKPSPYWQIFVLVDGVLLKYIKDITNKKELDKFKDLKGKKGIAKTTTTEQHIQPPVPFDLTSLQTEAYRFYGINPAKTLQIAQRLYLSGIISYPRTSSQKIPDAINPKKILQKLAENYAKEVKLAIRDKPIEGGKSDPAHPCIYPTGEDGKSELSGENAKIYDLIARRFISCFCEDAVVENKKIEFIVTDLKFITKGTQIKKKAWMDVYKAKLKETKLKDLNGEYKIQEVKIEEKQTQPPKRYTPASLVSELAKRNLGTKATRAGIIETLYQRGYVKGQSIEATELGISLVDTLKKHCPIIIDEKLTRNFEKEISDIEKSKKRLNEKEDKVLAEAKQAIIKISDKFKKEDKQIGGELIKANSKHVENLRKENELMQCNQCKKGKLIINYNKKSRRYFVSCNAYPECKTTFSLPPNGSIKKTDKDCEKCGWPMLMRISSGKRPWQFCFNPGCETNKEWQKKKAEYAKKK